MIDPLAPGAIQSVYVGVGSNTGDRQENIRKALALIREIPSTRIQKESELTEYAAEGVPEPQPAFLNGVILLQTELLPLDLLEKLQIVERRLGRATKGDLAPRPVDLDILSYGPDVVFTGKTLTIPHPKLHERRFVLEPLARLDPAWVHPKLKKTAQELLNEGHPVSPSS